MGRRRAEDGCRMTEGGTSHSLVGSGIRDNAGGHRYGFGLFLLPHRPQRGEREGGRRKAVLPTVLWEVEHELMQINSDTDLVGGNGNIGLDYWSLL